MLIPAPSWEMTTLHSAAQSPVAGSALLANNFPGCPSSVLPAQWAQGYWEEETGEMPAKSRFNSRRCTIAPGKTVAWVYSFCEDPGGCFFFILIPASYILQETQSSPLPFTVAVTFADVLQPNVSQPKSSV